MKRYSLREVMMMDQLLFQLANYEATSGLAFVPSDIDEAMEIQKTIAKKFNFFKRMIQNGECTLKELQQLVILRNGPIPSKNRNKTFEESLDIMLKDIDEEDSNRNQNHNNPSDNFSFKDILQKMMEDIAEKNGMGCGSDVVVRGPFYLPMPPIPDREDRSNWHSSPPKSLFEKLDKPKESQPPQSPQTPQTPKDAKDVQDAKDEKKKRPRKGEKGKRNP